MDVFQFGQCRIVIFQSIHELVDYLIYIIHNIYKLILLKLLLIQKIPLKTIQLLYLYVGCDVISSAVGMDKYVCKCVLKENALPILDCKCFDKKAFNDNSKKVITEIEKEIPYPVIVKPINLGSSVGIRIANNQEELQETMEEAFTYAKKILVEKAIKNLKEVNCSVLGDYEEAVASECEEPIKTDEILSYQDKYISGGKKMGGKLEGSKTSMNAGSLKLPADISKETKEMLGNILEELKTVKDIEKEVEQSKGEDDILLE